MATKKAAPADKKAAAAKPVGRPSTFTPELGDAICALVADGQSIRKICDADEMPAMSSVFKWLREMPEFSEQYAHAREAQADRLAEEILEIADDGLNDTYTDDNGNVRTDQDVIGRSRLRVDARKWLASKMAPKKYGDKIAVGGADDLPAVQITAIERRIVDPKK
jgi:hypothetical protein